MHTGRLKQLMDGILSTARVSSLDSQRYHNVHFTSQEGGYCFCIYWYIGLNDANTF